MKNICANGQSFLKNGQFTQNNLSIHNKKENEKPSLGKNTLNLSENSIFIYYYNENTF